jgi:transposase
VISDLSGVTGQLIVRAIIAGERAPWEFAELSHPRIQASRAEIAKSLEGNWRQELIFVLQQEIEMSDTYQRRVAECDQELQKQHLHAFADTVPPPAKENLPPKKKKKQNKNNPHFHLADELQRITGVDLTRIDGVDVMVAQTVVSEVGLDMSPQLRPSLREYSLRLDKLRLTCKISGYNMRQREWQSPMVEIRRRNTVQPKNSVEINPKS